MDDTTRPDRNGPQNWQSRPFSADNRLVLAVAFVTMCLGILIGGHLYGRYLASFSSPGLDDTIVELRTQVQKQAVKNDSLSAARTEMGAKLNGALVALDSIMPAPNTYTVYPNLTRIVGDGL